MAVFLLVLVFGWIVWSSVSDAHRDRSEARRQAQKIALRRRILENQPESVAAYEQLGDALRAANFPQDAADCFARAIALEAEHPATGSGMFAGSGLDNKLRLTRLEAAQDAGLTRATYGQTIRTRQQICRQCGMLGHPTDTECQVCGAPLPVDGFFDTLKNKKMVRSMTRETIEAMTMVFVIGIALSLASWMPMEIRATIAIAALPVIAWRFLKSIGPD